MKKTEESYGPLIWRITLGLVGIVGMMALLKFIGPAELMEPISYLVVTYCMTILIEDDQVFDGEKVPKLDRYWFRLMFTDIIYLVLFLSHYFLGISIRRLFTTSVVSPAIITMPSDYQVAYVVNYSLIILLLALATAFVYFKRGKKWDR